MKTVIIMLGLLGLTQAGTAQTNSGSNVQLKDLGVQPSNPNGPGKADVKPPDPAPSKVFEKAADIYKSVGSPTPMIDDKTKSVNGFSVSGSVSIP